MINKAKTSKELEERINFLKFDLEDKLHCARLYLKAGKIILADEKLEELQESLHQLFPFRFGSEMDFKGYSDKKVYLGKSTTPP